MNFHDQVRHNHPERSEGHGCWANQTLRCAQSLPWTKGRDNRPALSRPFYRSCLLKIITVWSGFIVGINSATCIQSLVPLSFIPRWSFVPQSWCAMFSELRILGDMFSLFWQLRSMVHVNFLTWTIEHYSFSRLFLFDGWGKLPEASQKQRHRIDWTASGFDGSVQIFDQSRPDMDKFIASVLPWAGARMRREGISFNHVGTKSTYALNTLNKITDARLPCEMPTAPNNRREPRRKGAPGLSPAPGRRPAGR